jgi:hypothetical protein
MPRFIDKLFPRSLGLNESPEQSVYVNFSNRGLSKIVKKVESLGTQSPDRGSVRQIARVLSEAKIEKGEGVGFQSIPEFVGLDYVGYIIEKQRLDKQSGRWVPIDEYKIIGSAAANFKDSRVAYGQTYRYRIRSIVSVTYKKEKESHESLELVEDVRRREKRQIKRQLRQRLTPLSNIDRITNLGLSNKLSTGKVSTTYGLLKNLKLRSDENRTEFVKSVEFPERLKNTRRLRNLRVRDLDIMKGSISQERLQKQLNRAISSIKENVIEYESFYYESRPSKNWLIVNVAESIPPPPPSAIKITPNSTHKTITINWLAPANSQRDIRKFSLYHKNAVEDRFRKVESFALDENIYVSSKFDFDSKHIFALTSTDVHGMESFLSTQIQVEFNPNYAIEKAEKPLKWISGSGAKPDESNVVFKSFLEPQDPIVAKESVTFSLKPHFNEENKKLFVRITSLDTHEKKEFNLTLKNVNEKKILRSDER